MSVRFSLKEKLQCELHVSRLRRVRHPPKAGVVNRGDHTIGAKIGVVESVESLGSELQLLRLGDAEVFQQGKVEVLDARSGQNAAARITKAEDTIVVVGD